MNKESILELARTLFFERGIKAVNMDDIATALGISKKTIYAHFTSKDEIVECEIDSHISEHACGIDRVKTLAKNAIDELRLIYQMDMETHRKMKPIFVADIQKYYPHCWKKLQDFFKTCVLKTIVENMQRGQEEGLYRSTIDVEFIASQYFHSIFNMVDFFAQQRSRSFGELEKELMYYHINGIGTPKGIKYLDKINFEL
ncbi:MAG: TetR/AcrR family transcriptional regulator [Chitinophagales bacterium]|nr:TetR/AcrR family transcriptional regulator [Chitinophagales bacterium]